uniref:Dinitrogenase iron-molybdenum cofactor biosynthesis protein n=1 Tax=uncultured Chloroflexota bacterium TaxID=166587 RepID=H5SL96_9CHLR|nr:dinitrogenase iron-molybdenum cofactor biosynthesis protein [uncultured Chloroflexota bacterium]
MSTLRIAAATEDGERLSAHFGMAPLYRVFVIENGQIVHEESRPKPHHEHHLRKEGAHDLHPHADMFAPIRDCQVLLAGGMGEPAYQKARAAGLEVFLSSGEIAAAITAYLQGKLQHDPRRIHRHA